MKTLLMFGSVMVFALSTLAVELTSSNVLGIQQVKQNKNDVVVPVTFAGVGTNGGAITLAETLYLDNLSMADTAMVMLNSSSGYYSQWVWLPGFMTGLYWTARRTDDTPIEAASQVLPRGAGIRVQAANAAKPVYTLGEYTSTNCSVTLNYRTTTVLTNPSTTKELDLEVVFSKGGASDYIYVVDNVGETAYQYNPTADSQGRHWYRKTAEHIANEDGTVSSMNTFTYDLPKVAPGGSFRYRRGTRGDLTVTW